MTSRASRDPRLTALGVRIRNLRIELGISQEELAHRSNLHRTYVGALERGERNLGLLNLFRIAKSLGVDPSELIAQESRHHQTGC